MSSLQLFSYSGQEVRTQLIDGEPWFVLNDLCKVLEIASPRNVAARIDSDDVRQTDVMDSMGRKQSTTIVNESGMYEVIIRSDKPEAKAFRRWLTSDVIPSIRRTGSYGVAAPTGQQLLALAVMEAQRVIESKDERIAELTPKAASWDSVISSAGSWSYNDAAKVLCEEGQIQIGEKRLVNLLIEWGYLYRDHKRRPHVYQRDLERGWFAVKARTYEDKETGEIKQSSAPQVRITGKGLDMIRTRLIIETNAKDAA